MAGLGLSHHATSCSSAGLDQNAKPAGEQKTFNLISQNHDSFSWMLWP